MLALRNMWRRVGDRIMQLATAATASVSTGIGSLFLAAREEGRPVSGCGAPLVWNEMEPVDLSNASTNEDEILKIQHYDASVLARTAASASGEVDIAVA